MSRVNVVLAVLLAAQILFLVAERYIGADTFVPRRPVSGGRLFPSYAAEQVATLTLVRSSGTTEIHQRGDGFIVASEQDKAADATLVNGALRALGDLKPGNVVSENRAKHEEFGVAGDDAIEVTAKNGAGQVLAEFVLGRSTPDWRGVYVRYPKDADDVMLLRANIRTTFDRGGGEPGAWRDKTVLRVDATAIRSIEIVKKDETVRIERQLTESTEKGNEGALLATAQDDWKVVQPVVGMMSRYAGNALAATIAELRADGFVPIGTNLVDIGLDPPVARVTATLEGGDTRVFEIGDEQDKVRTLRVPGQDDVYRVASYRVFEFLKDAEKMVDGGAKSRDGGRGD